MSDVIGIGTHVVECLRIGRLIERHGELFLRRVFTPAEISYCSSRGRAIQNYAAYWAGKESVLRALNTKLDGGTTMRDIELRLTPGETELKVGLGGNLKDLVARQGISNLRVSTSYCRNYATACAIAVAD